MAEFNFESFDSTMHIASFMLLHSDAPQQLKKLANVFYTNYIKCSLALPYISQHEDDMCLFMIMISQNISSFLFHTQSFERGTKT